MPKEEPNVREDTKQLITAWQSRLETARAHWDKKAFRRIRRDIEFAEGIQWEGQTELDDDRYRANIVQRHILTSVAALYAKNPTSVAKKRKTLDHKIWDEETESILSAMANVQAGIETPEDLMLISDFNSGEEYRHLVKRIGKTLEISWHWAIEDQIPTFKESLKALVTEVITAGVSYIKVGYRKPGSLKPEDAQKASNSQMRLKVLIGLLDDSEQDDFDQDDPRYAEMRQLIADIQNNPPTPQDEGLVYDFPSSDSIIVDPKCKRLRDFYGANWIAEQHVMDRDEIREVYGVDVDMHARTVEEETRDNQEIPPPSGAELDAEQLSKDEHYVWQVWDKRTGLTFTICDGYPDYLVVPRSPEISIEGFWPIRALIFNSLTTKKSIFPTSDVSLLAPMQKDYNRSREGLREHRYANRPRYLSRKGALTEDNKAELENPEPHTTVEVQANDDQPLERLVVPLQHAPIDLNMYETNSAMDDVSRVGGMQNSDFGVVEAQSKSTATGQSIAEGSRMSSLQSRIDDLDTFLTWVTRVSGQLLLEHQSEERAREIAGVGAVWPKLDRASIRRELHLNVKTGSSGRPNQAVDVSNMERMGPLLVQMPTISPEWMARKLIETLDPSADFTEAIASGIPSITAMNAEAARAATQPATGDPSTDPAAQGAQGARNAPSSGGSEGAQGGVAGPAAPVAAPPG